MRRGREDCNYPSSSGFSIRQNIVRVLIFSELKSGGALVRAMQIVCAMNAPHFPGYPMPTAAPAKIDEFLDSYEERQTDQTIADHPVSTLAVAIGASVAGGAAWTAFFLWFFHQWADVLIVVPLLLAAVAFGLFRWLFHRLH